MHNLFTFSIVFTNKNILTKVYLPLIITKVNIPFPYNFISKRILKYLFYIIFISKRFLKLDGHTEILMCSFFLSFFLLKRPLSYRNLFFCKLIIETRSNSNFLAAATLFRWRRICEVDVSQPSYL